MADYQLLNLFAASPYKHAWLVEPTDVVSADLSTITPPPNPAGFTGAMSLSAFSDDGRWLVIATAVQAHRIILYKRQDQEWVYKYSYDFAGTLTDLVINYDGSVVGFIRNDGVGFIVRRVGEILDVATQTQIATGINTVFSDISNEGDVIAYVNSTNPWNLRVYRDIAGVWTDISPVSTMLGNCNGGPKFSPDGKWLGVGRQTTPGQVAVCQVVGNNVNLISSAGWVNGSGNPVRIAWSGKSDKIACISNTITPARYYSFLVDTDTGTITLKPTAGLVSLSQTPNRLAFAPDGRFIAFGFGVSPWLQLIRVDEATDAHTNASTPPGAEASAVSDVQFSWINITGSVDLYNGAVPYLLMDVDLASLKIALLSSSASFIATDSTLDEVTASGANEVTSADWPAGGILLENARLIADGNNAYLTFDESGVVGLTEPITSYYAVIYDSSDPNGRPIAFIDFDGEQVATSEMSFTPGVTGFVLFEG